METLSGTKRLDWLKRQMDGALGDVETITSRAADEDRELSDSEQSTCEARRSRISELEPQIQVEADLAKRSASYQGLVASIGPVAALEPQMVERKQSAPDPGYSSPGAYLVDFCLRSENADARARFERYRAVSHQTTAQNPGLLPVPILEPVFIQQTQRRPAIEATTRRPLPAGGKTFTRPIITTHTTAGKQSAEKAELPSQAMVVDPLTVTKDTYGGVVNLSWQDRDWTDPAIMDLLVSDMAGSYAQATDAAFCAYFTAAVTAVQDLGDPSLGSAWLSAIYAGAGTIFSSTNALPDTVWCAPDVWGQLGGMVDTTGRPLFPTVNPGNALGNIQPTSFAGSIAGMRLVVDKNFPAGTAILGDSLYVESYETIGGQVSAMEPSVLGTQIAFYGYMAWKVLVPEAFIQLVDVVPGPTGSAATQGSGSGSKAAA